MKPRTAAISALALLAALAALAPAVMAADPPVAGAPIVAGPGAWVTTYATPRAVAETSGELLFVNGDAMRHNVVALRDFGDGSQPWCRSYPVGRCPAFWSALVGFGGDTPVLGLEDLTPGRSYEFYCTLHPGMRGTLLAVEAPSP